MTFERSLVDDLERELRRSHVLLQAVVGPRQVGKTTAAQQVVERLGWPCQFAAADMALPPGPEWIETQWRAASALAPSDRGPSILVLDEIQKVRGWSEIVKRLWDEDRRADHALRVLLLGSSSLLLQHGLTESQTGRFFLHRCPHWTWPECKTAFGWSLDQWLYFGGYPGAAVFAAEEHIWKQYVADSLIEPAIARDVLQLQTVHKPALLSHLFAFAASFPAQRISYNRMLGQLQDAGNTTTLANYLRLLETAFLVTGLELYSAGRVRRRGSSPKLILWNQGLISAISPFGFDEARSDRAWWGHVIENAVGAYLLNGLSEPAWQITYWRQGNAEVDFVVARGSCVWAIEVKSGRQGRVSGLATFKTRYPNARLLLIGAGGIPLKEFFAHPPDAFLTT